LAVFANALAANGFKLREPPPQAEPTAIGRFGYAGTIASKEDVVVDCNTQAQYIGVSCNSPEKLVKSFDEVLGVLTRHDLLGGPLKEWFLELQAHYEYWPPESPIKLLGRMSSDCRVLRDFEKILDRKCSFREIRVVPESINPDSADFFEVVMQPSPGRITSSFEILVILRNEDQAFVKRFTEKVNETVSRLVDAL
jgi:hypothetical protein